MKRLFPETRILSLSRRPIHLLKGVYGTTEIDPSHMALWDQSWHEQRDEINGVSIQKQIRRPLSVRAIKDGRWDNSGESGDELLKQLSLFLQDGGIAVVIPELYHQAVEEFGAWGRIACPADRLLELAGLNVYSHLQIAFGD